MNQMSDLIRDGARCATEHGHKMEKFRVYREGAMSRCKNCDRHVHVTTLKAGAIYGSATYRRCNS